MQATSNETVALEPRKPGRPPINGETADAHIHLRATLARKSAWVKAAKPEKLSEWITAKLDAAAKYQP